MGRKSKKMVFFCQLCNKVIENNVCQVHGIDFVTIKIVYENEPVAAEQNPPKEKDVYVESPESADSAEERRMNGMLQLKPHIASAGNERRLARPENSDPAAGLPVLPKDLPPNAPQLPESLQKGTTEEPGEVLADHPDFRDSRSFQTAGSSTPFPETPEYDDLETEELPDYHRQHSRMASQYAPESSGISKGLVAAAVLAILLLAAGGGYYWFNQPQATPTSLYSAAEQQYSSENYSAALQSYNRLVEHFPDDPLAQMAREKIKMLEPLTAVSTQLTPEQQQEIKELMVKANLAYQRERFLAPPNDNVVIHTRNILKIDSTYAPALEMQNDLISQFEALAQTALANGQFDVGIGFYQKILEIRPDDGGIIKKMGRILEEKSQSDQ